MQCRFSQRTLLAVTALSLAPVATASAEDAVNEVIVTARRYEERLQDVPISISVVSGQQLRDRNIVSAGDLGTYTPSLTTNSRFGANNTSFAIRGFSQDTQMAPSVAVYFADVAAMRAPAVTTFANGAGPGAFFDLQNVQVLKGPQGTLFGRNTTGGAVLLVPVKPGAEFGGYVEGSAGNYDLGRVQAVANIPFSDTVRFRVGIDRQKRDGYLINHSGIGPRDFNDVNYWAGRASLVIDFMPDLESYTIATYTRSDTHGSVPRLIACDRAPSAPIAQLLAPLGCAQLDRQNARGDSLYDVENSVVGANSLMDQWQAINTTTWQAADTLSIKNIISYGRFREADRQTYLGDNLILPLGPNAGQSFAVQQVLPLPGGYSAAQSQFTEELQFQGRALDNSLTWQGGGYLEVSDPIGFSGPMPETIAICNDLNPYNCMGVIPGASTLSTRASKSYLEDYGIYAQGTYNLTEKFGMTTGLRYTADRTRAIGRSVTYPLPIASLPPTGICSNTLVFGLPPPFGSNFNKTEAQCQQPDDVQKSHAPTWVIDFDYKPTQDLLLYTKYSRGYRQGSAFPFTYGFETFGPEKVDVYEIGSKTSFHGSGAIRGTFNMAAFFNDFTNQQLLVASIAAPTNPNQTSGNFVANAGKSRIAGVEFETSITLFEGFQVDGAYTYLDTKLKSITLPQPNALWSSFESTSLAGQPLTLSPKNRYTISATYTLPYKRPGAISLGATFAHTDEQFSTFADTPYVAKTGRDLGLLPAQNLLNLNLNWDSIFGRPVDLSFFATNVTNRAFPVNVYGGYGSLGFEGTAQNQPRMYGGRVRWRFGN